MMPLSRSRGDPLGAGLSPIKNYMPGARPVSVQPRTGKIQPPGEQHEKATTPYAPEVLPCFSAKNIGILWIFAG